MYTAGIITASDKGSTGEREDLSGKLIKEYLEKAGYIVKKTIILPDDVVRLADEMKHMSDELGLNLILTTGGTGFSKRDNTPEATMKVIERHVPGISEAIRVNSMRITPKAMLSRGISGIRGNTLIINLPGSPKAVRESLEIILEPIFHGIQILTGDTGECGNK